MFYDNNKQYQQYKFSLKETAAISTVSEYGIGQKFCDFLYQLNQKFHSKRAPAVKSGLKIRRWTELEPFIIKNPNTAGYYARENLGERWLEAEPYIRSDPKQALFYSRDVINGRWPEAEPIIAFDERHWPSYVRNNTPTPWQKFLINLDLQETYTIDFCNFFYSYYPKVPKEFSPEMLDTDWF